jgi:hypothetical protein
VSQRAGEPAAGPGRARDSIFSLAGRRPRLAPALARLALTAAVLGALLAFLPREALVEGFQRVSPALWGAVAVAFVAGHCVGALKWWVLLDAAGARPGAVETLRAHGAGLFANLCLPSLVGGDVVRAALLLRAGHAPEAVAVGSATDRVLDTAGLLGIAAVAALLAPGHLDPTLRRALAVSAVALVGASLAGVVALRLLDLRRLPAPVRRAGERVRASLGELALRPRAAAQALALSVAIQAGFVLLNAALGRAVGLDLALWVWFVAWPLAKIAALLPVSFGGIGVREAALVVLLRPFGAPAALAVAQGLLWAGVLLLGGLVAGVSALWMGRFVPAPASPGGALQETHG